MNSKKTLKKLIIGFFVLILVFTYISRSYYYSHLPKVQSTNISVASLTNQYIVNGQVNYIYTPLYYYSLGEYSSVKLLVSAGQNIFVDTPLFSVNVNELIIAKATIEVNLSSLKKQNMAVGDDKYQTALVDSQIATLNDQINELNKAIANKGIIMSTATGTANIKIGDGSPVKANQIILAVEKFYNQSYITWDMSSKDAQYFDEGSKATIALPIRSGKSAYPKNITLDLPIASVVHNPMSKDFSYRANIAPDNLQNEQIALKDGSVVVVTLNYNSGYKYNSVIPASSIIKINNISYVYVINKRHKVYGYEYYVTSLKVDVIDICGKYAAIQDIPRKDQLVKVATPKLSDGMAVYLSN